MWCLLYLNHGFHSGVMSRFYVNSRHISLSLRWSSIFGRSHLPPRVIFHGVIYSVHVLVSYLCYVERSSDDLQWRTNHLTTTHWSFDDTLIIRQWYNIDRLTMTHQSCDKATLTIWQWSMTYTDHPEWPHKMQWPLTSATLGGPKMITKRALIIQNWYFDLPHNGACVVMKRVHLWDMTHLSKPGY